MPICVRCADKGNNLFKGRFLCFAHFREVVDQLYKIIDVKEAREARLLSEQEHVAINSPRLVEYSDGRVWRMRGQHFTISKKELSKQI